MSSQAQPSSTLPPESNLAQTLNLAFSRELDQAQNFNLQNCEMINGHYFLATKFMVINYAVIEN